MQKIILASQSPRRKQLLEWADLEFNVIVSDADETIPEGKTFEGIAMHIAEQKALAVQPHANNNEVIIAADTIVICNNKVIGKPINKADAVDILSKLSGNVHEVITGVCMLQGNNKKLFSDTTKVVFHKLTNEQIEYYVDKYKPYDKAGAYAIQEWIGVVGIKEIQGDFYNVMGLPVSKVVAALKLMS